LKQKRRNSARAWAGEGKGKYLMKEEKKERGLPGILATMVADDGTARWRQVAKESRSRGWRTRRGLFVCVRLSSGKQGKLGF